MTSVALILVLSVVADAGSPPTLVPFAGGQTCIDSQDGVDHVTVKVAQGNVKAESWCDAGSFSDYFTLFTRFKAAIAKVNRDATLNLVNYPFRVNGAKKPLIFKTASSLAKSYAKIFMPEVQYKIEKAEPAAVFCRDGQAMISNGVVWVNRTGIAILNP